MLTRALTRAALALAAAAFVTAAWPATASANGNPAGGGFGSTQCGHSYTPGCTVTAGTPAHSGTGRSGTTTPSGAGSGQGTWCAGTVNPQAGCVPPGCPLTVPTVACLFRGPAPGDPGAPLPPLRALAQLDVRFLRLPGPVIRSSPPPGDLQLVDLPVWLWVNPAVWVPVSKTASVPGEQVTATATPVSVSWRMGDGTKVTCHGPGTPYPVGGNPASASPDCGYTYTTSSAGQPGGAYHVTATITWQIRWAGAGGAAGTLPPLFTTAAAAFRVAESQAINISGGQG